MRKLNSGQRQLRDDRWNHTGSAVTHGALALLRERGPLLTAVQEEFSLDWLVVGVSPVLLRERRVEIQKEIQKFSKNVDSVARGRAASLVTFSICAGKIRVIHES